jgi:plastocyanin
MRRTLATAVLLLTLVVPAAPRGQTPDTGTIAGKVTLTTKIRGAALPSTAYPTRAVGPSDAKPSPEMKNVVVYLKDAAFRGALPPRRAELHQAHEAFVPHVLTITRGSTVDFPNDDPIFHNVFSLSSAASFDLRRYPQGERRSQVFAKAGIVKVYCHIHSHMSATILVLDHPYYTVPADSGAFDLSNIPPGTYTIVGWHERVGERTDTVTVERGKATTIDLRLPVEDVK